MTAQGITIGDRIKARRKELKMSVPALASKSGLAASTLYDLERGDSISSTKLHKIAETLGLNANWLETNKGQRLATDAVGSVRERTHMYDLPISSEEADIGREWGKLEEPQRSAIAEQIHLLVAAQKRSDKTRRKPPKSDLAERGAD